MHYYKYFFDEAKQHSVKRLHRTISTERAHFFRLEYCLFLLLVSRWQNTNERQTKNQIRFITVNRVERLIAVHNNVVSSFMICVCARTWHCWIAIRWMDCYQFLHIWLAAACVSGIEARTHASTWINGESNVIVNVGLWGLSLKYAWISSARKKRTQKVWHMKRH